MIETSIDRPLWGICLAGILWASGAAAQDPAPAAADQPGQATQQYLEKLEEWKSLLKEMRSLQTHYSTAEEEEIAALRRRWEELETQGQEELIPALQSAGQRAYAEAPGQDRELERFLIKLTTDALMNDQYEEANELATAMLDAGCEVGLLFDAAGVAAFVANNYDAAEQFLARAQQVGSLGQTGANYLGLIPEYRSYWEEEQALRAKEAEADDLPRVRLTTTKGEIVVELFENEAPGTVGNFISLVDDDFYDGLTFHRVLSGFMAQGGCPLGTGTGGPGYNIYCECHQPGYRKHFRGTLSMAHAGRDTGGSQFFITFVPTSDLNGLHTAFGRVIEGMEVLAKLERIDPDAPDQTEPDRIVTAEVIRKRDHEYTPNKVN